MTVGKPWTCPPVVATISFAATSADGPNRAEKPVRSFSPAEVKQQPNSEPLSPKPLKLLSSAAWITHDSRASTKKLKV